MKNIQINVITFKPLTKSNLKSWSLIDPKKILDYQETCKKISFSIILRCDEQVCKVRFINLKILYFGNIIETKRYFDVFSPKINSNTSLGFLILVDEVKQGLNIAKAINNISVNLLNGYIGPPERLILYNKMNELDDSNFLIDPINEGKLRRFDKSFEEIIHDWLCPIHAEVKSLESLIVI